MKCPHCGYIDGWDSDAMHNKDGNEGGFFSMPIKMVREEPHDRQEREILGCPNCSKTFMKDGW